MAQVGCVSIIFTYITLLNFPKKPQKKRHNFFFLKKAYISLILYKFLIHKRNGLYGTKPRCLTSTKHGPLLSTSVDRNANGMDRGRESSLTSCSISFWIEVGSGQVNFNSIFYPHLLLYSKQIRTGEGFCGFLVGRHGLTRIEGRKEYPASRSIYLTDRSGLRADYIFFIPTYRLIWSESGPQLYQLRSICIPKYGGTKGTYICIHLKSTLVVQRFHTM